MLSGGQEIKKYPVLLSLSPSSSTWFPLSCLTHAGFPPVIPSKLQLQPPCALSGFLLLSEGSRVRIWFLQLWGCSSQLCSVGMFGLATLNQLEKREAGNLSSLHVLPPRRQVHKWQTKHRFAISLWGGTAHDLCSASVDWSSTDGGAVLPLGENAAVRYFSVRLDK